jgi:hypothetical protein
MPYAFEVVFPDFEPVKDELSRDADHVGLHIDCMFDEDCRINDGAFIDESTGENYDNSTATEVTETLLTGRVISIESLKRRPRFLDADQNDAAAQWLAANDPEFRRAA